MMQYDDTSVNGAIDGDDDEEGPPWDCDAQYDIEGVDGYGDADNEDDE